MLDADCSCCARVVCVLMVMRVSRHESLCGAKKVLTLWVVTINLPFNVALAFFT